MKPAADTKSFWGHQQLLLRRLDKMTQNKIELNTSNVTWAAAVSWISHALKGIACWGRHAQGWALQCVLGKATL